ncbi:hypothetical protein HFP72_17315 [Nocardiopsis sp. ARC36]
MPSWNFSSPKVSSAWLVPAGVPSVVEVRRRTELPPSWAKETLSASQEAPGTPGPPSQLRTFQPCARRAGSVWSP